ncbi:nitric oxide reductase activation protein NorD [Stutzerimonas kunmingensis]|uniref:nitric oxide reductase activation protein NorD n=1 Tax=Stutzerimonas kunmingensis TaxID=1211807 RepID=UPI0037D5D06E
MAEAEEVLTDAARHATVFAQRLWRRYSPAPDAPASLSLSEVAERLELLLSAVFDNSYRLRIAQPPARPTLLGNWFGRTPRPQRLAAVPATDGTSIWLPRSLDIPDRALAANLYKVMALQQAMRIGRGSALSHWRSLPPLAAALYQLLEAQAAECELLEEMPGFAESVRALRACAHARRPPLSAFGSARRPLEARVRALLIGEADCVPQSPTPEASCELAVRLLAEWGLEPASGGRIGQEPLFADWWTGMLLAPSTHHQHSAGAQSPFDPTQAAPQSVRLERRPDIRQARPDEDESEESGPLMIQLDEAHPHAEDPMGLQRPIDRDDADAELFGEMLGDLPQARLVASPGRPKEVLLADDPPDASAIAPAPGVSALQRGIAYPEWDYRRQHYREQHALVQVRTAPPGNPAWVAETLESHQGLLEGIRRRFELLRTHRAWLRGQVDGDELDLDAYVDAVANLRAGSGLTDRLYRTQRCAERNLAILLLIDVSGSTDSWISQGRRVIDVEREALLLVSIALQSLGAPYAIQAFSGQGREAVVVRDIKTFEEAYGQEVALRIASLEPEHYTRCGAAIRHASANLMCQPVARRLLLVLSDGKPSDNDDYEGRYGVEDTRQAVLEAVLQGISPFCLTIDRQASAYLPRIFGATRYALLPRPELLPTVLLDWMKRLVQG